MKIVVALSGGLDSTILVSHLKAQGHDLRTVSFGYGQRHADAELIAARRVATALDLLHARLWLDGVTCQFDPASSQLLATNEADHVPEGHYTDQSMTATVVPGRNLMMIAAATGYAASYGFEAVALAVHSGDHPVYPDCRTDFLMAAAEATALGYNVQLIFPFAKISKADIVTLGAEVGAPMELTWSCYNGGDLHCGRCGTCVERAEAFDLAGVPDPTRYESPEYFRTVTQGALA